MGQGDRLMIWFYSGTPGSGKSLSCARDVIEKIRRGQNVITNMTVKYDKVAPVDKRKKKKYGNVFHFSNEFLTPDNLMAYAYKHHTRGKEAQTLIIIDECQMILGPSVIKMKNQEDKNYRVNWLDFMTQHRHFGFNIILVSQFDRLVDPQIRCLFEYNIIHRKINSFGSFGKIMTILKINLFLRIEKFYGNSMKLSTEMFTYKKKYGNIYDSYSRWDKLLAEKKRIDQIKKAS